MEDYLKTYTLFRKIDRISDLVNLCPMENEAAFVTLQNFGREAYGMYWSTEEFYEDNDIPEDAEWKEIMIPFAKDEIGKAVMGWVFTLYYDPTGELGSAKAAAIPVETIINLYDNEVGVLGQGNS